MGDPQVPHMALWKLSGAAVSGREAPFIPHVGLPWGAWPQSSNTHPGPHGVEDGSEGWVGTAKGRPGAQEMGGGKAAEHVRWQEVGWLRSWVFKSPVHAALCHRTALQNTFKDEIIIKTLKRAAEEA